jgi:hypothetical protein
LESDYRTVLLPFGGGTVVGIGLNAVQFPARVSIMD